MIFSPFETLSAWTDVKAPFFFHLSSFAKKNYRRSSPERLDEAEESEGASASTKRWGSETLLQPQFHLCSWTMTYWRLLSVSLTWSARFLGGWHDLLPMFVTLWTVHCRNPGRRLRCLPTDLWAPRVWIYCGCVLYRWKLPGSTVSWGFIAEVSNEWCSETTRRSNADSILPLLNSGSGCPSFDSNYGSSFFSVLHLFPVLWLVRMSWVLAGSDLIVCWKNHHCIDFLPTFRKILLMVTLREQSCRLLHLRLAVA